MKNKEDIKKEFQKQLDNFAETLKEYVSDKNNQWTIKGFIDIFQNIYSISADTKIVSKVLEIHLFPRFLEFAEKNGYELILAEHQNWYPDISFVSKKDSRIKFAVDLKTTYILNDYPDHCNGFTLGSHGAYFIEREKSKNIQFPYNEYLGHYCLGIIYSRTELDKLEETKIYNLSEIENIPSVINNFTFFAIEKWKIASDKSGSGNTANIGSIQKISDILAGNGVFKNLGEEWFDEYWINYGKIHTKDESGKTKKITTLTDFLKYRGKDENLANPRAKKLKLRRDNDEE
ncbi:MAG: EcoRV family type II restriction endonuclease [Bacteroidales bacterium]|nr:EcoRV family type II restriction endonuclease [Bacteroidales bacterium]